jgi:hypothetical protein
LKEVEGMTDKIVDVNEPIKEENVPDFMSVDIKNPKIGKVLALEEDAKKQYELELERKKKIQVEQEYVNQMIENVERHLASTREEERLNSEFERKIQTEIYRMHGISEDKLEGMEERDNAIFQGIALATFIISILIFALCSYLHGITSEISIFTAFFTAIEGTLLSKGKKENKILETIIRTIYMILLPVIIVAFILFEANPAMYALIMPYCIAVGVVILMVGAISYFIYNPYRTAKQNRRKADSYIREMEKVARKDVALREKELKKQEKKREKDKIKSEKIDQRAQKIADIKRKIFRKNGESDLDDYNEGETTAHSNVTENKTSESQTTVYKEDDNASKVNAEATNTTAKTSENNNTSKETEIKDNSKSENTTDNKSDKNEEKTTETSNANKTESKEQSISAIDMMKKMQAGNK